MDQTTRYHLRRTATDYLAALVAWDNGNDETEADRVADTAWAFDNEVAKLDSFPEANALTAIAQLAADEGGKPAHLEAFLTLLGAVE